MAKWVTEQLTELLHQINDVPYDDNRESRQLGSVKNLALFLRSSC